MNGSMASMQMYAKQIRYGRKQTSICFSPSQPSGTRSWVVLRKTPLQTDAGLWEEGAGRPEQLGLSITSPTMWQTWTQFLSCTATANGPDAPVGKNCYTVWNPCSLVELWRGGGEAHEQHTSPRPAAAQTYMLLISDLMCLMLTTGCQCKLLWPSPYPTVSSRCCFPSTQQDGFRLFSAFFAGVAFLLAKAVIITQVLYPLPLPLAQSLRALGKGMGRWFF